MNGAGRCVDAQGNPMDFCSTETVSTTSGVRPGVNQFGGYEADPMRDRSLEYNRQGYLRNGYDTWRAKWQAGKYR